MPRLSVVIPVYKAEDCLHELYSRLSSSLDKITDDFEIIMVEDCGADRSWNIICDLASKDRRVRGFQFSRNFGQHYGITAGLEQSSGDWVVVMDCDLQDQPEEIPRLHAKALQGYDIVIAKRGKRKDPFIKRVVSKAFYKTLSFLADVHYDSEIGNFRIVSRQVVNNYCLMRERLRFFSVMVDWMGFKTATIDVQHAERYKGKSTYTFRKLWNLAADTIIAYSDKPLRLSIRFGFIMAGAAFAYGTYIFVRALFLGSPVQGWSSLIVSLYFVGGIIIANLGIIGIYLGKTFDETKQRPLYIIGQRTPDERT